MPVLDLNANDQYRHAHLDDPGRTEWEGFPSGTKAAVAGMSVMFFFFCKFSKQVNNLASLCSIQVV